MLFSSQEIRRQTLSADGAMIEPVTIGDCTLYQGDCLEVMPTLAPESITLLWTDPPYGHNNHADDLNSRLNEHREIEDKPIANDSPEAMRSVVDGMLRHAVRILRKDCCCCCCGGGGGGPRPTFAWVANRMDAEGLSFFHSVIWDKTNPGLGWRFRRQHEMVMVSHRSGGKLAWAKDDKAIPNIIRVMPPRDRLHPNEKPEKLVEQFIALITNEGDVVLDPFMGSGTTGAVCARLGRKFVGIEMDAGHFAVAAKRIRSIVECPSLFVGAA